jgi:hypothetical protein
MTGFIFLPPFLVIIPLLGSIFTRLFVIGHDLVWMLEILPMRLGSNCNGNFFSMKLVIGIMWNLFAKLTKSKCKMSTLKSSPNRLFQKCPPRNNFRQEEDTAFGSKFILRHSPGFMHTTFRIIFRILRAYVSCQKRFLGTVLQFCKHVFQKSVPVLDEAHVAINLKRIRFILLHFLNFITSPARASGFCIRHVYNAKARIVVPARQVMKGILGMLLIANSKHKQIGILGLRDAVFHRGLQLRVAIRCDLNENGHLSYKEIL